MQEKTIELDSDIPEGLSYRVEGKWIEDFHQFVINFTVEELDVAFIVWIVVFNYNLSDDRPCSNRDRTSKQTQIKSKTTAAAMACDVAYMFVVLNQ